MRHQLACLLFTLPLLAAAQAPAPQAPSAAPPTQAARPATAVTKVAGTDNVYIFRNVNHQSMFVVTPAGVIATDPIAYGRPNGGQQYVDAIRSVTSQPIRYLVYSHHHFDHVAGGKAFKDAGATIVAHRRVRERLLPINDPHTPLPDEVFGDEGRTLSLGGTTLELKYLGASHSDTNVVMFLPREKLVFVVDTIPVGQVPGRGMIDFYPDQAEDFIRKVMALDWDRLIPGHPGVNDRLGTKKDAADQLELLQKASAEMKQLAQDGKCWDSAEKEFKLSGYENWPGYKDNLQFIARRYCGYWGRGT
jgi:glyoxylase-like metal-dependent hydrolase (beta-lactamase superfamily II)